MSNKSHLSQRIKKSILSAGFQKVGIAAAKVLDRSVHLEDWLNQKKHGTMQWMEKHIEKRKDVTKLYPEVKSIISVAQNYYTNHKHSNNPQKCKISRYAWGKDYHTIMKNKLKSLLKAVEGGN